MKNLFLIISFLIIFPVTDSDHKGCHSNCSDNTEQKTEEKSEEYHENMDSKQDQPRGSSSEPNSCSFLSIE